jgi:hypothetical protein
MSEARDPRLDAPGDENPGVRPSNFDLIALEQTRYGLRGIGVAMFTLSLGAAASLRQFSSNAIPIVAWSMWTVGATLMLVALTITAPTPHGPLPKPMRNVFLILFALSLASALLHLYCLVSNFSPPDVVGAAFGLIGVLLLLATFILLPAILYRFCQHRGLTGRAIVWLWIAMGMCGAGVLNTSWHPAVWFIPVLGLIAMIAAQQTARDVWLDAVYRHSKFFVITNPKADVVPLHPADKH